MSKVITFSRTFPKGHPKAGQPTYFVEQVLNAIGIDYRGTKYFRLLVELNPKIDSNILSEFHQSLPRGRTNSKKLHTIRSGNRWKAGEQASPRIWSGRPYFDPQIIFAPDQEVKQVGDFVIKECERYDDILEMSIPEIWIDIGTKYNYPHTCSMDMSIIPMVAKNDGLSTNDLLDWFKYPKPFEGQIIAWKEFVLLERRAKLIPHIEFDQHEAFFADEVIFEILVHHLIYIHGIDQRLSGRDFLQVVDSFTFPAVETFAHDTV